jgi:DHA1 family bicyclomycin/chloramphenicol resistance-like MFS transporter
MLQPGGETQQLEALRRSPMRIMPVVTAMTATGPLALNIIIPALPALVVTFDTDRGTVQLLLSLYLFGIAVSQFVTGTLSDRFGRRPMMIIGLSITILTSIGALLATNIGGLVVARMLQSFGASTGIVLGRTVIRDLYSREQSASMIAGVTSVTIIAPMVAPVIGGFLDTLYGWRAIFLFLALMNALMLAWVVAGLPETRPSDLAPESLVSLMRNITALFRSRKFLGYVMTLSLGTVPVFAFMGGAPHVVVSIMHRTSAEYGLWSSLLGVSFMLGSIGATRLIPRWGVDRTMTLGLWIMVAGTLSGIPSEYLLADSGPLTIFAPQTVTAFGNGLFMPTGIAAAVSVKPEAAGTASGVCGFFQMAIGAFCAQLVGILLIGAASAWPMTLMIVIFALVTLTSYFLLLGIRR